MLQELSDSRQRLVQGTGTGADVGREAVSKGSQISIGSIIGALLWMNVIEPYGVLTEGSHEYFIAFVVWLVAVLPVVWLWGSGVLARRRQRRTLRRQMQSDQQTRRKP